MKRILAIWLPDWPIQRLASARPELRDEIIILQQATARGGYVAACSSLARQLGIRENLPIAEATALAFRRKRRRKSNAPPFHLEDYDPHEDRLALEKLAGWCHQYSPFVGLEELHPPETLLLDVTGLAPLFGGEQMLLEQVERGFQRLHLTARMALADSVGAAWAIAHYGCRNRDASETQVTAAGENCMAIQPLPLAALRLPATIVETLGRLGLQTIGEILLLPRAELQPRFGTILLDRVDQALGESQEIIQAVKPPPEFTAEWFLEYPLEQRAAIHQLIERLIDRLTNRLASAGEGFLRIVCELHAPPLSPVSFEIGLLQPTIDQRHLLELIRIQMEQVRLPGPVNRILVRVLQHARLRWRQQGLFDSAERKSDAPQVATLVDRLANRLGRQAVVRCVLQSDAQPEMAFRREPLIGSGTRKKRPSSTRSSLAPLDRPLHLLDEPTPIPVLATVPEGPPVRFHFRDRDYSVGRHWGPERIETGWWRRRGVQRDYYRVETQTGHRFWLFRQIQGNWFLHGVFD